MSQIALTSGRAALEDLVRTTTRRLFRRTEAVALLAQSCWITSTSFVDKVTPMGAWTLRGYALAHALAALAALSKGGPFVRGGGWRVLWLGAAMLTPALMAAVVPYGEYGSSPACVQLCGYPVPPLIFLAFYPWIARASAMRDGLTALLVSGFVAGPLLMMMVTHPYLTRDNWLAWVISASMYLLAYLVGWTIGRVCRAATTAQVEIERAAFSRSYDTLHDEVEHILDSAIIHQRTGETSAMRGELGRIMEVIRRERSTILLTDEQVPVAKLVELQVSLLEGSGLAVRTPRVGPLSARQEVAEVLGPGLSALLKNVRRHAQATEVTIEIWREGDFLVTEVADNGTGFPDAVLDDPGQSLHQLRLRAIAIGGDLVKVARPELGSVLQLWLPMHALHGVAAQRSTR